ncbi:aminomethyl-transferring glycine dehydrogenase subunit GcvPA [Trichococcus sp. K1Tr]|jgi:glycine dehydrogenase subunit 1|uniref:aminomethyl-transferring glycine dehydrogenase subunit GcvPA n=1 Tax=Trichococcus TaxID=82802 RepID=UPI00232D35F1|nr:MULTISPECIES: aminomethyl-transferring glycine dehydrogenase subunit GcvPA [Trichococcus]MDB6353976.1 aminomethyl-transferring glycine dehydrogenase subunit GcvPA [Trichococcus sp. K1Tr]
MTEEQFRYLPDTAEDEKEMLAVIGVKSMEDLFTDIPEEIRQKEELAIPSAVSESELLKQMKALAEKNVSAGQMPIFMGAGTYDHYIPSVVDAVISRSEFYTAYTPYQAEASQGELQAIFEFQSMISELTGMEATNSSLYDGFASLSEAVGLAAAVTKRNEIVLSQAVHPNARAVIHAAAKGRGLDVIEVLMEKDVTNFNVTRCLTTPDTAAIVVQYPNFFGSVEDLAVVKKIAEDKGALLIVMANPLALGILEAPGNLGADIVVGDTQPFGLPMSFGGPHCGYFSVNQKHIRKVPGRIVGETVDAAGERAFVLTLQSREQHIRREKATSYMSSNQALNALASAVCMAALGKQGVQEMAQLNVDKAAYFAQALQAKGFAILNQAPFFNEFVIDLSFPAEEANRALLEAGIIGGYSLAETYHKPNQLLVCATEKRTKEEIDRFIAVLEGMNHA